MSTLIELLTSRAATAPDQLALLTNRRGRWIPTTYGELVGRIEATAVRLAACGVGPGTTTAIALGNGPEFLIVDLAVQSLGGVSAAIPVTDDDELLADHVRDAGGTAVVAVDAVELDRLRGLVAAGRLDDIGCMLHVTDDGEDGGTLFHSVSVDRAVEITASERRTHDPDAPATITFTAGGGGRPRPVVHTGAVLLAQATNAATALGLVADDVTVVALEPAHPAERAVTLYPALVAGAVLAYPESDATIDQAMLEVQPTFLHLPVSRLRLATARVRARVRRNRGVKKLVTRWWERAALERIARGQAPSRVAVGIVGRRARRSLGWGGTRSLMVTGESVPADVVATLGALGLGIREGYALVETGLVALADSTGSLRALPGWDVSSENDELVLRGSAAGDTGGIVRSGDIGGAADGRITVTGSLSSVCELGGRRLVTAEVERRLRDSPYIARAVVRPLDGVLHAAVEIDRAAVTDWAASRRLPFTTFASLVSLPQVRELIADEVARTGPEVERHDLLNHPLRQGRDITRTGRTIHAGSNVDVEHTPTSRTEPAPAVE